MLQRKRDTIFMIFKINLLKLLSYFKCFENIYFIINFKLQIEKYFFFLC